MARKEWERQHVKKWWEGFQLCKWTGPVVEQTGVIDNQHHTFALTVLVHVS